MEDLIRLVKEKNMILDVAAELIGFEPSQVGEYTYDFSPCPICGHNSDFRVDTDKNIATCFRSDNSGASDKNNKGMDVIDLVRRLKHLDFPSALIYLANRVGIELPSDLIKLSEAMENKRIECEILTETALYYHSTLTAEAKAYLTARGISEFIIKRFKIGFAVRGLLLHLQEQGYSLEQIQKARVINEDGSDYYSGCITFPNWQDSRVIDIQGRTISPKQYRNRRGPISYLFNEQVLRSGGDVFIHEGIPDTLSSIQMGFNAVGIYGAGGFKEEWVEKFDKNSLVYILLDSDEAGATASKKIAGLIGEKARIVKLEGYKDINELLMDKGDQAREIIEQFIKNSLTLTELLINEVPEDINLRDLDLTDIFERIAELAPSKQNYYINLINKRFKLPIKDIRTEIKQTEKALSARGLEDVEDENDIGQMLIQDPEFIRLGLDFLDDKALVSRNFLLLKKTKKGLEYTTYEPKVITSDFELLSIPQRRTNDPYELLTFRLDSKRLLAVRHDFSQAKSRWSRSGNPYSVESFLKNESPKVDMGGLYKEIYSLFKKYFYSEDEENYVICTLYTMVTYFHQLFRSLGYIHLNGVAGSGKSTLARVFEFLCFNGSLVIEPSDASIFRMAEHFQLTMIIDEKENISNRAANKIYGALMTMLKSRYQKGACVPRQNMDNKAKSEEFSVYGPTIIANVNGLEDILQTRAIPIQTKIVPQKIEKRIVGKQPEDNLEFSLIRDRLYCSVMQYFKEIRNLAESDTRGQTSARDNEIFHPLIVMGSFIDSFLGEPHVKNDVDKAIGNKLKLRELNKERSPEEMLKLALSELLANKGQNKPGGEATFTVYDIKESIEIVYGEKQDWIKNDWIGSRLKSIGMIKGDEDRERIRLKHISVNYPIDIPRNMPIEITGNPEIKIQCYKIRFDRL